VRSADGPSDERGRSERTLKLERARRRSRDVTQRNVVRFAVVVAMVLAALATGIGLGFGLYYFFKPIHSAQQSVLEPPSTIRRSLDQ
jgi:hypothetical protein